MWQNDNAFVTAHQMGSLSVDYQASSRAYMGAKWGKSAYLQRSHCGGANNFSISRP
jgi:hypothetical protein